MFGRNARLPVDLCFGTALDGNSETSHLQYVDKMRKELQKAYHLAAECATKSHLRNKTCYDQRVRDQPLQEGDRVLVRNVGLTGKHKLQDRWKSTPYIVIKKFSNLPVDRVKPEQGTGSVKTQHRDHLLQIGYLVRIPDNSEQTKRVRTPVTRRQHTLRHQTHHQNDQTSDISSNSESEYECVYECPTYDKVRKPLSIPDRTTPEHTPFENFPSSESEPEVEKVHSVSSQEEEYQSSNEEADTNDTAEDTDVELRTQTSPRSRKSTREVKPVIRLTYDKPGTQAGEPVTIVHQSMVIHLNLSARGNPDLVKHPKTCPYRSKSKQYS